MNRDKLLAALASLDDDLLDVIAAAGRVHRKFFGRRVKLNYLVNMKSVMWQEDCDYCSQRRESTAEILKYSSIDAMEATGHAHCAIDAGAKRICLVAAGRGPGAGELSGPVRRRLRDRRHRGTHSAGRSPRSRLTRQRAAGTTISANIYP